MVAKYLQAPNVPASFIVGQILIGDRDKLARGGGATGQGEHVDFRVGEKGRGFPFEDALHVGFDVFVATNGDDLAEVGERLHVGEAMVFAEGGAGLMREDTAEKVLLDFLWILGGFFKGGETPSYDDRDDFAKTRCEGAS